MVHECDGCDDEGRRSRVRVCPWCIGDDDAGDPPGPSQVPPGKGMIKKNGGIDGDNTR